MFLCKPIGVVIRLRISKAGILYYLSGNFVVSKREFVRSPIVKERQESRARLVKSQRETA